MASSSPYDCLSSPACVVCADRCRGAVLEAEDAGARLRRPRATTKKKPYSAPTAKARRAQLARARAAARASELREAQTPRFRVDEFGREVPDVRAEAAIIYNPETNEVLWADHAEDLRSIASITKVMTALVFLDSGAALDAGHRGAHRRVPRVDDVSPHRLQTDGGRPAQSPAGGLRQCRRARAGSRRRYARPASSIR